MPQNFLDSIYLDEKLVVLDINAKDNFQALDMLSEYLKKEGRVKSNFNLAIKRREEEFPTGLMLEHIGVAIPHTDVEYVNEQSMAIGILENPVDFTIMGTEKDKVGVKVIFMLAIKEPHTQLEFLQSLIGIFQKDEKVLKLLDCETPSEVLHVFKSYFIEGDE